ncbi:hypothetical protein ACFE04_013407 [Oxalis oulophora]
MGLCWSSSAHHHNKPDNYNTTTSPQLTTTTSTGKNATATASATANVIAVKRLNSESFQGFEEWQSEVNFLGRLSHPNLVKLLGYCWEDKDLLLVYEFMQKGSLENHLFGRGQPLPWELRLKIAIGAARGLAFLHTSDKQVIYRDFKASNILLDGHIAIMESNALRYISGHLYVKSDVYGFGVVLTEMLTGLRALDTTRPTGKHTLADWIKPFLSNRRKLKSIMDSRMEGKYPSKAAFRVSVLSLKCLESEPKNRPSMKEVVETLERIEASNELPRESRIRSTQSMPNRHNRSSFHARQVEHQQSPRVR